MPDIREVARWARVRARQLARAGRATTRERLGGLEVSFLEHGDFVRRFEEVWTAGAHDLEPLGGTPRLIDVGANIGLAVLRAKARHPRARITAFEAGPEAAATLAWNVEANQLANVEVLPAWAGLRAGRRAAFARPGAPELGAWAERRSPADVELEVEEADLAAYVYGPVDLLRLGAAASAEPLLHGLAERGVLREVRRIDAEVHHALRPGQSPLARLLSLLDAQGYACQLQVGPERQGLQRVRLRAEQPAPP